MGKQVRAPKPPRTPKPPRPAKVPRVKDPDANPLEAALDAALAMPSGKVHAYVDRIRAKNPGATPEQVIEKLTKRYLTSVSTSGGAVGAVAAAPAVGTGIAIALTATQVAGFVGASALYALAVADVHGISTDDPARRRALLSTALLGPEGPEMLRTTAGLSAAAWGQALLTKVPLGTVKAVNAAIKGRMAKAGIAKVGSVMLGRLLPFGIGMVVGFASSRAMGKGMIEGVRSAFGPAPVLFSRPVRAAIT